MDNKFSIARKLRNNMTKQEKKLWYFLRMRNINNARFRRQYPIGSYIVDFVCLHKKLIVEVDGGQHNFADNLLLDEERTKFLQTKGYTVLRFWNNDIDYNITAVLNKISSFLQ